MSANIYVSVCIIKKTVCIIRGLFTDTSVWPLGQSLYYHGILPLVPGPIPSHQSLQSPLELSLSSAHLQSHLAVILVSLLTVP